METTVGIRKLRDELTRYLGRVRRGGRLVVTDRGRPVALLLPYGQGRPSSRAERLGALLAGGHVGAAEKHFLRRRPLVRGKGPLLSDLVTESRR